MSITKVGSSYNFIYNTKTGKLSTKDGSKNEFVDFCNGDVKGEDTETLNHFDEHTRYQFTRMLFAYGTGMTGQNPIAAFTGFATLPDNLIRMFIPSFIIPDSVTLNFINSLL